MAEGMTLEEQGEVGRAFVADLLSQKSVWKGQWRPGSSTRTRSRSPGLGEDLGILVVPQEGSSRALAALQDLTRAVVQRQSPSRTRALSWRPWPAIEGAALGHAEAVERPDRRGGQEVRPGEGSGADESGRPQGCARRHQRDGRGRDPLRRRRSPTATSSSRPRTDQSSVPGANEGYSLPHPLAPSSCWKTAPSGSSGPRSTGATDPPHGEGFVAIALRLSPGGPARLVDLGSGGGLPGLVVAVQSGRHPPRPLRGQPQAAPPPPGRRSSDWEWRTGSRFRRSGPRSWAAYRNSGPASTACWPAPSAVRPWWPIAPAPLLKTGGWLLVSEPPAF